MILLQNALDREKAFKRAVDKCQTQINELLSRAEKGLQVLLKKENILQAKVIVATLTVFFLSFSYDVLCRLRHPRRDHPPELPPLTLPA